MLHKPFPKHHILGPFKVKEFVDDNFKFNENGEQFLLFPQCFQQACNKETKTRACLGKG